MDNYEKFYQLHHQEQPFILGNVWNVKSAQILENAGYDAIATSSGAIAGSLGYPDGEKIPFDKLLYIVERISASTTIPLTVDMERGYSDDLDVLNQNIQKIIDCGVCGINIEDAQGEEIFSRKLSSIKNYLLSTNQKLFINARTDVFLQKLENPTATILQRAIKYQNLGADGLFVPGVQDLEMIKTICVGTKLPVNIVATPKNPDLESIANCGIKRISMAVFLYNSVYNKLESVAKNVKAENSFTPLFQ